ncbi:MAG TPA: metalloregulator ArsR/SmtB family transcription factor [Candidatus Dormibacteraeota bacterium]|nr:metalloregulator ArsR/SmtB family transcription factor [Candidatus Dormibacteraeota bacterium]
MRQRAVAAGTLDRTLVALADPTRRRLIERLGGKSQRASDLGRGLPMSRPAVSRHLRVLREAGLVASEPDGREMRYRLAHPRRLEEVRQYVDRVSQFWDQALEAFKAFAEQERE